MAGTDLDVTCLHGIHFREVYIFNKITDVCPPQNTYLCERGFFEDTTILRTSSFLLPSPKHIPTLLEKKTESKRMTAKSLWCIAAAVGLCIAQVHAFQARVKAGRRKTFLRVGSSYLDSLSSAAPPSASSSFQNQQPNGSSDAFLVGVVGDLHMDPRIMDDYQIGREHWSKIFGQAQAADLNTALVSLGDLGKFIHSACKKGCFVARMVSCSRKDALAVSHFSHPSAHLGESKNCDHNENNPSELFAGTSQCHFLAAEYLRSIHPNYEVVGGNHDLEGIDEFPTDAENLDLFLRAHNKPTPQFIQYVADKTVLVGMTSTLFRDAKYTSHEVTIDQDQIDWFENVCQTHPASEGWKIFVFTHAPPNGSGLRVLQENHVVNGCCWLNHSNEAQCQKFINLVREHRCIKAWFSGHFHLGQDYQDSITFPTVDPKDGPYPNRGSCVFAQTSVMRSGTSRDGRQQSRVIRGNSQGFDICTVDHAKGCALRVDATITYSDCNHEVGVYTHEDITLKGDKFFKVYAPCAGDKYHPPDENLVNYDDNGELHIKYPITMESKAWWFMACGRVLGLLNGMMIEYDASTLAPLGLVVGADELIGKRISVIDSGIDEGCFVEFSEEGMEGADCSNAGAEREQALLLIGEDGSVVVVQPNEDGSFWRKIVRNKMIREREKRREIAAKEFLQSQDVVSSWGP